MAETMVARPTLYDVLRSKPDWGDLSDNNFRIPRPSDSAATGEPPRISPERLKTILNLVPEVFPLKVARGYYAIAYGSDLGLVGQQQALLDEICNSEEPKLGLDELAGILGRASWRIEPEELQ